MESNATTKQETATMNYIDLSIIRHHNESVLNAVRRGISNRNEIAAYCNIAVLDVCRALRRLIARGVVECHNDR
jgi:hypothetical protein